MCSNLLEKINKEDRESESGGMILDKEEGQMSFSGDNTIERQKSQKQRLKYGKK